MKPALELTDTDICLRVGIDGGLTISLVGVTEPPLLSTEEVARLSQLWEDQGSTFDSQNPDHVAIGRVLLAEDPHAESGLSEHSGLAVSESGPTTTASGGPGTSRGE